MIFNGTMENATIARPQAGTRQTVKLEKVRYCLYARKSTESEERQVLSIDSQIKEMLALAEREEGGTPDIVGDLRAGIAFVLKDAAGAAAIRDHDVALARTAVERLLLPA